MELDRDLNQSGGSSHTDRFRNFNDVERAMAGAVESLNPLDPMALNY